MAVGEMGRRAWVVRHGYGPDSQIYTVSTTAEHSGLRGVPLAYTACERMRCGCMRVPYVVVDVLRCV